MRKFFTYGLNRSVRSGFTLVEVLLSLSISALIMFGCCALMFDMVSLSEHFERDWSFRSHVDGVEKFLRSSFISSKIDDISALGTVSQKNSAGTIYLAKDPEDGTMGEDYLAFGVDGDHPFYPSPTVFSPAKVCFLEWKDGEGLFIVWRFIVSESRNSEPAVYKEIVSKWVEKVGYLYYDETKGWEEEDEIRSDSASDSNVMPSFLKLYFRRGDETYERIISLEGFADTSNT